MSLCRRQAPGHYLFVANPCLLHQRTLHLHYVASAPSCIRERHLWLFLPLTPWTDCMAAKVTGFGAVSPPAARGPALTHAASCPIHTRPRMSSLGSLCAAGTKVLVPQGACPGAWEHGPPNQSCTAAPHHCRRRGRSKSRAWAWAPGRGLGSFVTPPPLSYLPPAHKLNARLSRRVSLPRHTRLVPFPRQPGNGATRRDWLQLNRISQQPGGSFSGKQE